jgi:phosphatidate cytidylyltransferase
VLLFSFIPKLLMLPLESTGGDPSSHYYLIYLVAITKLTDMGAYIVGSLIGRDKMIPHVSPGKTWQGFGGAIFFAVAGSFALYFAMGDRIPLITPIHAFFLAVILALIAVLGDLAESILKRSLEAKDSGHVMPGIGGFLDLIDSVIFTAPVFYIYLLIFS